MVKKKRRKKAKQQGDPIPKGAKRCPLCKGRGGGSGYSEMGTFTFGGCSLCHDFGYI